MLVYCFMCGFEYSWWVAPEIGAKESPRCSLVRNRRGGSLAPAPSRSTMGRATNSVVLPAPWWPGSASVQGCDLGCLGLLVACFSWRFRTRLGVTSSDLRQAGLPWSGPLSFGPIISVCPLHGGPACRRPGEVTPLGPNYSGNLLWFSSFFLFFVFGVIFWTKEFIFLVVGFCFVAPFGTEVSRLLFWGVLPVSLPPLFLCKEAR